LIEYERPEAVADFQRARRARHAVILQSLENAQDLIQQLREP
jgi:hypothetical protein